MCEHPKLILCFRSAGISTLGWCLGLASVTNFIASMIVGIAALNHPTYVIEKWHIWIIFVAVTWCAVGLNVFATRILPMWNKFICGYSLFVRPAIEPIPLTHKQCTSLPPPLESP